MENISLFTPVFWMYFSHVLSFIVPLFSGITLLTVKGEPANKLAGIHPRHLLGLTFIITGLLFIPNMMQNVHQYTTGELGLPAFDIAVNLFLIPLYFFYFRKLTKPERLRRGLVLLSFLPAMIVVVLALFIFPFREQTVQLQENYIHGPLRTTFQYACLALQAVMIATYGKRIVHLKRAHVLTLEDNYSSTENIDLKWLNRAIPLAILYATVALAMSAVQAAWSDYLFHVSTIVFVFYLYIHALNEPYINYSERHARDLQQSVPAPEQIVEEEQEPAPDTSETPNPAPEPEISTVFPPLPEKYLKNLGEKREKMKDELVRLFDEQEIYTNGSLTIHDVANLLGTNRTYVSNVINNEFGYSFYQFVNKYRVQKATILLLQHPDMQIQEVATLAGFNSLSSFITSFKLNEGITPKQWKQRYANPA